MIRKLFKIIVLLGFVFLIYLALTKIYVFQVNGNSMEPTIKNGDYILVVKTKKVKRKKIIVFFDPKTNTNKKIIKRVYGIGGDYLIIKKNGYSIKIKIKKGDKQYLKIPANSYFVVGDNLPVSEDSREGWFVTRDLTIGTAVIIFYPLKRIKILY